MDVALPQSRAGDAHEPRLGLQLLDAPTADVAHPRTQAAYQLIHHGFQRAAIGYAPLNALRHKFSQPISRVPLAIHHALGPLGQLALSRSLEVPLSAALRHRRKRAHAAISLERPALIQN